MFKNVLHRHGSQRSVHSPEHPPTHKSNFTRNNIRSESMRIPNSSLSFVQKSKKPSRNLFGGSCQSLHTDSPRFRNHQTNNTSYNNDFSICEDSSLYEAHTDSPNNTMHTSNKPFFKRYNSLTNLLMNSFRKAKGKRRSHQIPETQLDRTVNESNPVFKKIVEEETANENHHHHHHQQHTQRPRRKPSITPNESVSYIPKSPSGSSVNESEAEADKGEIVFLGAKVISNDFIDNPYDPRNNSKSSSEKPKIQPSFQQKLQALKQTEKVYQRQADLYAKLKDYQKSNNSIYSSMISLNNSPSNQQLNNQSIDQSTTITVPRYKRNTTEKPMNINKGLSVSNQHLNGDLVDLYSSIDKKNKSTIKRRNTTAPMATPDLGLSYTSSKQHHISCDTNLIDMEVEDEVTKLAGTKKSDYVRSVGRSSSKKFTEQMQEMLNKVKHQKNIEKVSQQSLLQSIGDYKSYDKYRTEQPTLSQLIEPCDLSRPKAKGPHLSLEAESDDIEELISVLATQNEKFKAKFFECLMTKLWDTNLPLREYLQLNKLMSALFGEGYHKIDPDMSVSTSKINYLNYSSTRNSKEDAEHIVNLMKSYLDSKNPRMQEEYIQAKQMQRNVEDDFDFVTVSSLLESLRVRQKMDEVGTAGMQGPSQTNVLELESYKQLNSIKLQSNLSSDRFDLFENNEPFAFKNGFTGLQNNNANSDKNSLNIKLSDEEDEGEEAHITLPSEAEASKEDDYDKCIDAYIKSLLGNNKQKAPRAASPKAAPKPAPRQQELLKQVETTFESEEITIDPVRAPFQRNSRLRKTITGHHTNSMLKVTAPEATKTKPRSSELVKPEKTKIFRDDPLPNIESCSLRHVNSLKSTTTQLQIQRSIASFQPSQKFSLANSSSASSSNSKPSIQCSDTKIYDKWAKSVVRNIFNANDTKMYREDAEKSYYSRAGMQASQHDNDSLEHKSEKKSSTKVKNLLQVFNSLSSEGKGQAPLAPPLQKKLENSNKPKVYKKFDQSSYENDQQQQKRYSRCREESTRSKASASTFMPFQESRNNSLRLRLEKWNQMQHQFVNQEQQYHIRHHKQHGKSHQKISDLIAEKIYKFERKEMQQAYY